MKRSWLKKNAGTDERQIEQIDYSIGLFVMRLESFIIMTQETINKVSFVVDGIEYIRPCYTNSVYVRQIMQFFEMDARLAPMVVKNNKEKAGLMDSEVDEEYLREYWEK
jgi:hypothetical protein